MAAAADQADVRSHAIEREHYERILSVTRRLASTSDLQEVLGTIIDALKIVLRADRASVFQYDAETHELFATRAHGLAADLRLPADRGIIGEAARTRLIVNIPDAYADARFNQEVDSKTGYRTRCLLTVPLMDYEGKLVGVAQVLNKDIEWGGIFVVEDEVLAQHLADQAAMALKRAALLDAERQKHKLEADLQVAKRIQQASLPASLPAIPGYSIAADTLPADETGGDAFDVIDLRKWKGENAHADAMIFLADATGHGIGPALSITQAASMVRMGCRIGASLDEIALHVNNQLCTDLPAGRFVTAFLGHLDLKHNKITYISAGQAPILVISPPDSGREDRIILSTTGMPFGIDEGFVSDPIDPLPMEVGDVFALLSDGFFEAANSAGHLYGHDRIVEVIKAHAHCPAAEILGAIRADLRRYSTSRHRADDQTAVLIKRTA